MKHALVLLAISVALSGCATATLGDKTTEAELKKFTPIPGRVSVYVCRPNLFTGSAVGVEVIVNGTSIGSLKTNTFAHTSVAPGKVAVFLRRKGIGPNSGDSGTLELQASSGDVRIVWAGQAGLIGPVTVDSFNTLADAEACVRAADYAVP
ncbi:hypothetical protein [Aquabacterium humicola]|jgi:hypothetical protein|uniref:hypothetical protein n=1 Tax=Aquabacterium humicola TaxID=3237377 RepID=UPI0025434972|nr:hypothetical protein [Rubrivivax pictus]